jgi:hypothetical protein
VTEMGTEYNYVILTRGAPGQGKSTWVNKVVKELREQYPESHLVLDTVSTDNHFTSTNGEYEFDGGAVVTAHAATQYEAADIMVLTPRYNVPHLLFVDNTNLTPGELFFYILMCDISIKPKWRPLIVDFRNNPVRENQHGVPAHQVQRMLDNSRRDFRKAFPENRDKYSTSAIDCVVYLQEDEAILSMNPKQAYEAIMSFVEKRNESWKKKRKL